MNNNRNTIIKKVAIGATIVGGVILGASLIPITMGFGTAGIVGGSIAAGIQASIGSVVAGSAFTICTSLGMTGVFAASAAVGAILCAGGFAAYLKSRFNAKKDAELIEKVIKENDNPFIIIKIIECRFPSQRNEIKYEYEKLNEDNNTPLNFIPQNKREHFLYLMIQTEEIIAKTDEVKTFFDNKSFDKYLKKNLMKSKRWY